MKTPLDLQQRRTFIRQAAAGSTIAVLGGLYFFNDGLTDQARAQSRADGRPRLPPGQRVIERLKPMGGQPGSANPADVQFRIHGEVGKPKSWSYRELLAVPSVELALDVHCVTGWSVLGARFRGVRLAELADRVGVSDRARHAIFEAAAGYTANVVRQQALAPSTLIVFEHEGRPLARAHGAPLRAVVPELYFWKSAKWLTGVKFTHRDEPGYWEKRGYHNYADPWREQRYG